jgi:hypothetical protein
VNSLEGGYKGKTKNYQNYQTPTSQVTSINFAKPPSQTNLIKQNSQQITKAITNGETTDNQKNSYHPYQ